MFVSEDIGNLDMVVIMSLLMGICVVILGLFREGGVIFIISDLPHTQSLCRIRGVDKASLLLQVETDISVV